MVQHYEFSTMHSIHYLLCLVFLISYVESDQPLNILTESMKSGIKKLGEKCMTTVGATMEEMNSIKHGPPYKGKSSCVIGCIFEKANIMVSKKFSKKGLVNKVTPFLLGDTKKINHIKMIGNDCENETASLDMNECQVAENIVICLRKHIPQIKDIEL